MRQIPLIACAISIFIAYTSIGFAQDVNERYPLRIPDWLWDNDATAHLLSTEEILTLRDDILKLAQLEKASNSRAADSLEKDIAKRLLVSSPSVISLSEQPS